MRVVKADDYQTWFIEENDYGVLIDPWLDKKLNPENSVLLQRERKEASSLSQEELDKVEVQEGDTLEDIKAKLKPKKQAISAEMLDTANTYDDKVAVIRMIVADEAGRVSNVFKNMMKEQPIDN